MRIFSIFEIVIIVWFLYLAANITRYLFFKDFEMGKFFGMSDKWIKKEKRKR